MLKQPERESRNVNALFYEMEGRQIQKMNKVLADVELTKAEEKTLIWLAGWEESTVEHLLSVIEKAARIWADRSKQMEKTAASVIEGEALDILVGSAPLCGEEKDAVVAHILKLLKETYDIEKEDRSDISVSNKNLQTPFCPSDIRSFPSKSYIFPSGFLNI